jgi:hypothetical protein
MEVRLAAVLRLRELLRTVAARLPQSAGTEEERRAFESLQACEQLARDRQSDRVELVPEQRFRRSRRHRGRLAAVRHGWASDSAARTRRRSRARARGRAADILGIFPESPAEAAGLELGDIILGPPGQPF